MKRSLIIWGGVAFTALLVIVLVILLAPVGSQEVELETLSVTILVDGEESPPRLPLGTKSASWSVAGADGCILYRTNIVPGDVFLAIPDSPDAEQGPLPFIKGWGPVSEVFALPAGVDSDYYEFPSRHTLVISEFEPGDYEYALRCTKKIGRGKLRVGSDTVKFTITPPQHENSR